jgi:hypothetical protein
MPRVISRSLALIVEVRPHSVSVWPILRRIPRELQRLPLLSPRDPILIPRSTIICLRQLEAWIRSPRPEPHAPLLTHAISNVRGRNVRHTLERPWKTVAKHIHNLRKAAVGTAKVHLV